jgi:hypothetical protein
MDGPSHGGGRFPEDVCALAAGWRWTGSKSATFAFAPDRHLAGLPSHTTVTPLWDSGEKGKPPGTVVIPRSSSGSGGVTWRKGTQIPRQLARTSWSWAA